LRVLGFFFFFGGMFSDMSTLHTDSQGRIHKRSREEVGAAIERINSRTIVIERGVLRPDIKVAPFDFIYHTFHENG
jgi:hypothetical protein